MMNTIAQQLRDAPVGQDDYVGYLYDVLDGIVQLDDADAVFAEAFSFFERNSDADLGTPGPLVHFLERFYPAYVDQLYVSVKRKPTTCTVWMVNRILNSSVEATDREPSCPLGDAVLIQDYGKGVCTKRVLRSLIGRAREADIPVLVDPARRRDWYDYEGCTLIKANRVEAAEGLGVRTGESKCWSIKRHRSEACGSRGRYREGGLTQGGARTGKAALQR